MALCHQYQEIKMILDSNYSKRKCEKCKCEFKRENGQITIIILE